ncbi:hypothetical protein N7G274_000803 [Stereocaulon virgatum]|uniref:Uncharacterized protein n=1 Tax=Stereocaulon virgatum TaxID=373712 RepID=A0ABR4ANI7_9LECA
MSVPNGSLAKAYHHIDRHNETYILISNNEKMYPTRMLRMQPTRCLGLQATQPLFGPVPKEEHSAHTISQRLRTLKKIPPELMPLGVVLAVAIGFAFYSMGSKLVTDKTLRLHKTTRSETYK